MANHLNDISKNHPDWVAEVIADWFQVSSPNRQKLLKHAARTLIKQGHPATLSVFGFGDTSKLDVSLVLDKQKMKLGETICLRLTINNRSEQINQLLIDYVVYHKKANGSLTPKVFKWKTAALCKNKQVEIEKKHTIKAITTRKYYSGEHKVAVQINGKIFESKTFELTV